MDIIESVTGKLNLNLGDMSNPNIIIEGIKIDNTSNDSNDSDDEEGEEEEDEEEEEEEEDDDDDDVQDEENISGHNLIDDNNDENNNNSNEESSEENHVDKIKNDNNLIDNIIPKTINNKIENGEEEENSENTFTTTTVENLGSEGGTYKIIFTSLSQSLCAFAENSFVRGLKRNSGISCDISPTNQKTYENNGKLN